MIVKKLVNLKASLTEEQIAELESLNQINDDDILFEADCPPSTDEEVDWSLYIQKKYNTRKITKEIIKLAENQMTKKQLIAYEYMRLKNSYIIELLEEYGDMTQSQLDECMREHPIYEFYSQEEIDRRKRAKSAATSTQALTANG